VTYNGEEREDIVLEILSVVGRHCGVRDDHELHVALLGHGPFPPPMTLLLFTPYSEKQKTRVYCILRINGINSFCSILAV